MLSFSNIIFRRNKGNLERCVPYKFSVKKFLQLELYQSDTWRQHKNEYLRIKKLHFNRKGSSVCFRQKKILNFIVEKWFLSQLKYTYNENENVSIASIATVWDGKKALKNIRININKLIFGSLNINFSRNKFDLRCK